MSSWSDSLGRGIVSGTIASLTSTAMLTLCGWREGRRPAAPSNGPSQWIWGESAAYEKCPTVRETVVGYCVHHASSIFWAVLHEKVFGASAQTTASSRPIARGLTTAAVALFVDYRLTPRRFRPGFDKHLSTASIVLAYAAFGGGLALRELTSRVAAVVRTSAGGCKS
jgi:hypothetical protein